MYTRTSAVLLVVAIVIGIMVAVHAEGAEPTGVFFEATHLTADLEGTGIGQIKPFGAESPALALARQRGASVCPEGLVAIESDSSISASLAPHCGSSAGDTELFSQTTRVWVEHTSAVTFTVSFKSGEGYGLGQCEIGPAGDGRAWGYCEHDPLGDSPALRKRSAAQVISPTGPSSTLPRTQR